MVLQPLPSSLKQAKVLIVDDLTFYASLMEQTLMRRGFEGKIYIANSLKGAADRIQQSLESDEIIDLLITDLHLPDGLGTRLVKKIRKTKVLENMAILLVTTNEESKTVVEAFEAGIDNYLFKPLEDAKLFEKILFVWNKRHPG